jgi:hypothetical protein
MDCFIPPTDIKSGSVGEAMELAHGERSRAGPPPPPPGCRAKVAALGKAEEGKVAWGGGTVLENQN